MSEVEQIKISSNYLRGSIEESLADSVTGAVADSDIQLLKFHGTYQQDDRDLRLERRRLKLEPAYSFMIRARLPGGVCNSSQWLALDTLAQDYANNSIRLTTRQAFQLHGVIKKNLKPTIAAMNQALISTLSACGDVSRNVMCSPNPELSSVHSAVFDLSRQVALELAPQTRAYHEIWLDGEKLEQDSEVVEPLYGNTYLPRKFKIGFAVPPDNDVDVFSQDLGFIAIVEEGRLLGFNVAVGGGMGATHGDASTFPRLGDVLGFCTPEQVVDVAKTIVTIQRDHGNREERKQARFKYTVDRLGIPWLAAEVDKRLADDYQQSGLQQPWPFVFEGNGDRYGWQQTANGDWMLLLFIENGRVSDQEEYQLMTAMRTLAKQYDLEFRITPNQNLMIAGVTSAEKNSIDELLNSYGVITERQHSALRLHSMACVGFPTCALAMAESERYLPDFVGRLEEEVSTLGLYDVPVTVRMTGCPNGCARPYIAEIGLVGKAPGRYNLYLGASFVGDRLGTQVLDNADEATILDTLKPLLAGYAEQRQSGERFGDYLHRTEQIEGLQP